MKTIKLIIAVLLLTLNLQAQNIMFSPHCSVKQVYELEYDNEAQTFGDIDMSIEVYSGDGDVYLMYTGSYVNVNNVNGLFFDVKSEVMAADTLGAEAYPEHAGSFEDKFGFTNLVYQNGHSKDFVVLSYLEGRLIAVRTRDTNNKGIMCTCIKTYAE